MWQQPSRQTIALAALGLIAIALLAATTSRVSPEKLHRRGRAVEDDCLWDLTASQTPATLTSPRHPDLYPSNADCHWLITADDPGATLTLRIDVLDIEQDSGCRLDYLKVYLGPEPQGPALGPFCGSERDRVLETNASRVLLEFHSDAVYEDQGFSVQYFTTGCRKSVAAGLGTLTSPGFPEKYPDEVDCWTLVKAEEGKEVLLIFDVVDLEFGDDCTFDFVRVFDGQTQNATLLGRLCQESAAKSFESSTGALLIHFHSDDSVGHKGYQARYSAVDKSNQAIGDCLWERAAENGTVSSPNYPENYPSSANCSLWIVAPEDAIVILFFDALLLEIEHNCSYDFLLISEGTGPDSRDVGRFCGLPMEVRRLESTRNRVRIQFESDASLEFSGFRLRYHFKREQPTTEGRATTADDTLEFAVTPGNVTLSEGSSAVLPCDILHPNARIRWLKSDVFLGGESTPSGLRLLPNDSLAIERMGRHLVGRYTCVAVAPEGEIASHAHVAMPDAPPCQVDFRKTPSDSVFDEGDFAHLECLADGEEQMIMSWEKDGQPLRTDERVTVVANGYVVVQRIQPEDEGTYTCVAATQEGCIGRASAKLKVAQRASIEEVCGQAKVGPKKKSQSDHAKTVGGSDAPEGAYPWQVMLWDPNLGPFCGGTLLNERWVATAAHCIPESRGVRWNTLRLLLGKHARRRGVEPEMESRLAGPSSIMQHPSYRGMIFDNDLALLRMARPVRFSDRVLPACLGDRNLTEALLSAGAMGTVIGWGRLKENGAYPKYLQEIQLPVVDQEACLQSTNYTVTRNMFCAGYSQEVIGDACQGDSGGPFLLRHEGRWYLVGVVSWGDGCGRQNKYGFYTRVSNHLSWIRAVIQN